MIRILLVEDNRQICENILQYLSNEFEVDTANNGTIALEKLRLYEYDLAVLDLMLPEVNGMSILSDIRSSGHNIGVIFLTAKEELGEKLRAFEIGANDYLTKPFFLEELKARIYLILRNMGKISLKMIDTPKTSQCIRCRKGSLF
jgi:DNA-binding response OmpR family regulator